MKKIVVLTGAGISAESGISTFRDANGLWENHRIEDVASPEGWRRNKSLVLDFYNQRRRQLLSCQPNAGHLALVELEKKYDVVIVTQNVDDLHERAGSSKIIHLHGELLKARSSSDISLVYDWVKDINLGDKCEKGSQLRPHIVWFGESVPNMIPAIEQAERADLFLVVGTSLIVYPAAGLMHHCPAGIPLWLVDPNDVPAPRAANLTRIQKSAAIGLPELVEQLMKND